MVEKFKAFYDLIDGYLTIVILIWSIFQYFYYNKFKVYIFVTKLFSKWRDTEWEVSFTFDINKEVKVFKDIEEVIKDMYKVKKIKKVMNLGNSKIYSLKNFLFKVTVNDDTQTEYKEVFIEIPKLKTTYSHAKDLLNELELLSKRLGTKLKTQNEIYSINIRFKNGKNPFLGFMLQRLGKESIKHLMCELDTSKFMKTGTADLYNQKASIYKDYLNVTQKNFADLKENVKILLLLK